MLKQFSQALVFSVFAAAASAQTPGEVGDLLGARAAGGETQLEARGYRVITANEVGDTKWTIWWNERQGQCISVATNDGRYTALSKVPEANCRSGGVGPVAVDRNSGDRGDYGNKRRGESLTLVCYGSGSSLETQSYSGYGWNKDKRRFEPQFGTTLGREGFSSDVQVEIDNGQGQIHLTGELVSPIHSGGVDGWWPIQNLVVTRDRITGSYRMNGLNKPKFEIDRRTRTIRIKASTEFTGRCDSGNWDSGF